MRLWHKDLIPFLPRQQLLGQWRECCLIAKQIAEKGTPNHVLVNRVMEYPINHFHDYAAMIDDEMQARGYRSNWSRFAMWNIGYATWYTPPAYEDMFGDWHNNRYLRQCLANLQEKADAGAIPAEEWQLITDRWPEWR
jgi:uncharacterized protein (TIGR02328 family)